MILALTPAEANGLVDDGKHVPLARLCRECLPIRAACMDLGLGKLPNPKRLFALGIDRPLYYSVHSAAAKLAPEERPRSPLARYLGTDEHPEREELEAEFETLLDAVQPGWRGEIVTRKIMRDLVVANDLPRATRGGLAGRAPVPVSGIANLWLAGDWVGRLGLARGRLVRQRARCGGSRRGRARGARGGMSEASSDVSPRGTDFARVFAAERRLLFGLCYRMTGSAADADDIVQETFARALAQPAARGERPWRPWLVRVALNLARDELRRRRRRAYKGPWLPEPVDDADLVEPAHEPAATTGRYELLESVSFAFLLALEALTPAQRAVLLLRDVFEYTSLEAAEALDLSEANARVLLHRARRAMAAYDKARFVPDRAARERSLELLGRFMAAFARQDVAGMEAMLADDVVTLNDTNGRYPAAGVAVTGRNEGRALPRRHRAPARRPGGTRSRCAGRTAGRRPWSSSSPFPATDWRRAS